MLVIPTVEGTVMIGPTAEMLLDKYDSTTSSQNLEKVFSSASMMVKGISRRDIISSFAGLRPTLESEDFLIRRSELAPGLTQAAGIQSPGLTAAPAVAETIKELLKADGVKFVEKPSFIAQLSPHPEVRKLSLEELDKLSASDPAYANIVCRCEQISEAEIVDAIRKGHHTLDGVKFYVRAGMGRCQGGFCSFKIMRLIARETGIPMESITKRGPGSEIAAGRLEGTAANHV
jgi:glycerol-3-phosphate dehydrogenase